MGRIQEALGVRREEQEVGVYAHIPFCIRKCPYCDFKSVESKAPPGLRYALSLKKELAMRLAQEGLEGPSVPTLYLGGGTPSLFAAEELTPIIEEIKRLAGRHAGAQELTIEANPDTVGLDKLKGYRAAGLNRISLGFQSLDDRHLASLGRTHGAGKALSSFALAREAGFANIGIDLIFGVPGQDLSGWGRTLEEAIRLCPEHVSVYGLTIEEGTPFSRLHLSGTLPGEEAEAEMYSLAIGLLKGAGYEHYEVSNFARPGFRSRHNSIYWGGKGYLGLGSSAHSYLPWPDWGRRWWNEADPYAYMELLEKGRDPAVGAEALSREDAMLETVMLGLRLVEDGVDRGAFEARFGIALEDAFPAFGGLFDEGLAEKAGKGVRLAGRGLFLLNEILRRLA